MDGDSDSIERLREVFERIVSDDGKYPGAVERTERGYCLMQTQHDWEAWRACAEALMSFDFFFPVLDRLQDRLELGAVISFQEGYWWLFTKEGDGICSGRSIREMLVSLIFVDC